MLKAFALLEHLADGEAHSGEAIATKLGVSRAAVWSQIKRLQAEGVEIHAVSGKGYRLHGGFEFLDEALINLGLGDASRASLRALHLDRVTDSTNERLLEALGEGDVHGVAWFAEYQSAGRGRRGGTWLAPPGSGLCLSLAWRIDTPPSTMSALSLVVGIALVRALERLGARDLKLKWPNDIFHNERKLAGILIEMRSEFGGPCTVVIGIGVNVFLSNDASARIDEQATDVASACGSRPSRNIAAAYILDELCAVLSEFTAAGFAPYRDEWQRYDLLKGRRIGLQNVDRTIIGTGRGVGPDGTLLIESNGKIEPHLAGHIILDPPP